MSGTLLTRCFVSQIVERNVDLVGLLIDQHGVSVGKGRAPDVLPAEPDVESLIEKGAHCEALGRSPIDPRSRFHFLLPVANVHLLQMGMNVLEGRIDLCFMLFDLQVFHNAYKAFRYFDGLHSDVLEDLQIRSGVPLGNGRRRLFHPRPVRLSDLSLRLVTVNLLVVFHAVIVVLLNRTLNVHFGQYSLCDELLGVRIRQCARGVDLLIEKRVGEGRVVELVVAVTTVADEVDEDVFAVASLILDRQSRRFHGRLEEMGSCGVFRASLMRLDAYLGVVAVHVDDGCPDLLR